MSPAGAVGLAELDELARAVSHLPHGGRAETLATIKRPGGGTLPLQAVALGSEDPRAPVMALVGGIHGLERIGSQVIVAWLHGMLARLGWSRSLKEQLDRMRILLIPVANPVGMARGTRCNGNGIDLMRNSPVEAAAAVRFFGGQRISAKLPFYRGEPGEPLQEELQAIERYLRRQAFESRCAVILDLHSGFGVRDRLWFPFARSQDPFPQLAEVASLFTFYEEAFPNHPYVIEPQSRSYCTHGDFWDYLYDRFHSEEGSVERLFLPLTLEMGSWIWIRKRPTQAFSFIGAFNPLAPHRRRRVLRRHVGLLDFVRDAVDACDSWYRPETGKRSTLESTALARWYGR